MIPFKPQLALDIGKVKPGTLEFPLWISLKHDGVWCCCVRDGDELTTYSRTGEVFTSMRHIEAEFSKILPDKCAIIFEAYALNNTPQPVISGWVRDTKQQHLELIAVCHTKVPLGDMHIPFVYTFGALRTTILKGKVDRRIITFAEQQPVYSLEEAIDWANLAIAHGGEGAVLRNPRAGYQSGKRNKDIIKIKQGVSFDLEVVDVYEGRGKYYGTLGGLRCRWKDGATIDISGMRDDQRTAWWASPNMIVGKIVQVDAMCVSSKGLLREPRFKGIRHDKTEGDF